MSEKEQKVRSRGICLAMPLKKNLPDPGNAGWTLTNCPECGQECWQRPAPHWLREVIVEEVCTECAIKKTIKN